MRRETMIPIIPLKSEVVYKKELDWLLCFYNCFNDEMEGMRKLALKRLPFLVEHYDEKIDEGKDMLERIGNLITYAALKKYENKK